MVYISTHNNEIASRLRLSLKVLSHEPVRGRQQEERHHEREEDDDKDNVGSQRADEEDEADETHEEEPEADARVEALGRQARGGGTVGGRVAGEGGKGWGESRAVGEVEAAKGAEDDGGEGVAEDPFEDAAGEHEETAHEEVDATILRMRICSVYHTGKELDENWEEERRTLKKHRRRQHHADP